MSMTEQNSNSDFSDKVGSIAIGGENFQLCDHVQKIEGVYFATAFAAAPLKDGKDLKTGIYYKKLASVDLAFIPVEKLETAEIIYDDKNQTKDMLERAVKAVRNMNTMKYTEVA